MKALPRAQLWSCLWLVLPLLAFNLVFASRLPARYSAAAAVPTWLAWLEHGLRVVVFVGPVFIPLAIGEAHQRWGLKIFAVGVLVYVASWLPILLAPESGWSRSVLGGLAPAYTPLGFFLGIAVIGRSSVYGLAALAFLITHNASTWLKLTGDG